MRRCRGGGAAAGRSIPVMCGKSTRGYPQPICPACDSRAVASASEDSNACAIVRARTDVRFGSTARLEEPMLTAPPTNADEAIAALLASPEFAPLIVAHRQIEPRAAEARAVAGGRRSPARRLDAGGRHRGAVHPPGRGLRGRPRRPQRGRRHADRVGQDPLLQPAGRRRGRQGPHGPGAVPLPHQGARRGPARRPCGRWPTEPTSTSRRTRTTATRRPTCGAWCGPRARWSSPTRTCSTPRSSRTTRSGSSSSRTCSTWSSTSCTRTAGSSAATSPT